MVIPKTVNMLRSILAQAPADDCELLLTKSDTSLTRFAGSAIHQSSQTEERCLRIRVIVDGRAGVFETGRFDHESVLLAVQKAAEIARLQPAPARPIQLPAAAPIADSSAYDEQTARSTPFDRAEVIRSMCGIAGDAGCELAGALTTLAPCSLTLLPIIVGGSLQGASNRDATRRAIINQFLVEAVVLSSFARI